VGEHLSTSAICVVGEPHPACSRALHGSPSPPRLEVAASDVERLALETVNRRLALTGVQRKLSLSYMGGGNDRQLTIVGVLGGSHILKPQSPENPCMSELEHLTMVLARACGPCLPLRHDLDDLVAELAGLGVGAAADVAGAGPPYPGPCPRAHRDGERDA
jgi:hypothetical protein